MENQIIALSYGPDEKPLARTDVMNYFAEYGFQPSEDDTGFMNYGPHKETVFICSVFEKTGYVLFKEFHGRELPEPVFAFINQLHDPTTIVSLGVENPDSWDAITTDSEYTLKRFKSLWAEDIPDEEV